MIRTEGGHFWMRFPNGYTLSAFNGFGSHTENHDAFEKWNEITKPGKNNIFENYWESELIEIAVLGSDGEFKTKEVLGYDDDVQTVDLQGLIEAINKMNV